MGLVITASIASAGVGSITTLFAQLGIRARKLWNAEHKCAPGCSGCTPCGTCGQKGAGCVNGVCAEWL